MMMKRASLKTQIIKYGAVSFAITCLFIIATYLFNQYLNFKQAMDFETNKLVSTAQKQAEQILPGLLVAEEYGSVDMQLSKFKETENLVSATFVKSPDSSLTSLLSCPAGTGRTYVCTSYLRNEIVTATEVGMPGEPVGYFIKHMSLRNLPQNTNIMISLAILFGAIALVFLALIMSILFFIERKVRVPLLNLKEQLSPILDGASGTELSPFSVEELQSVGSQVAQLVRQCEEKKVAAAIGDLAAQVAHDVQSPLKLLRTLAKDIHGLSSENQKILRMATDRITKITSDLLEKHRAENLAASQTSTFGLIAIEKIITEKQILHGDSGAEIELHVNESAAPAFLAVNPTELIRALSNLIENAVQAYDGNAAKITVAYELLESKMARISVMDKGRGIPDNIIGTLGEKGVTHRPNGNGLGLYHARTLAEGVGGQFKISSQVGVGTTVSLMLPLIHSPEWFADSIKLSPNQSLVSIDDDSSIHAAWEYRFEDRLKKSHSCLSEDILSDIIDPKNFFLVDNQISTHGDRGSDFIEKNNLASRSILVTHDFESESLQIRCRKIGCKILPKPLLPYVQIIDDNRESVSPETYDFVLIDNDELMRMAWYLQARDTKKRVAIFQSLDEFLRSKIATDTPIYVDYHLGDGLSGVDVAQTLKNNGYESLHITTSDPRIKDLPPYIKSVQGKDFPAA